MSLSELLTESTKWFAWLGAGLGVITLIAFLTKWSAKFRLIGATVFSLLLSGSCFAFSKSYSPPYTVEGAKYAPIVYDNGEDLVVAQASEDFPEESVQPTLEQIAGNLKGGGRNGSLVHIRIRRIVPSGEGSSIPIVLGEVIRDVNGQITLPSEFKTDPKQINSSYSQSIESFESGDTSSMSDNIDGVQLEDVSKDISSLEDNQILESVPEELNSKNGIIKEPNPYQLKPEEQSID